MRRFSWFDFGFVIVMSTLWTVASCFNHECKSTGLIIVIFVVFFVTFLVLTRVSAKLFKKRRDMAYADLAKIGFSSIPVNSPLKENFTSILEKDYRRLGLFLLKKKNLSYVFIKGPNSFSFGEVVTVVGSVNGSSISINSRSILPWAVDSGNNVLNVISILNLIGGPEGKT